MKYLIAFLVFILPMLGQAQSLQFPVSTAGGPTAFNVSGGNATLDLTASQTYTFCTTSCTQARTDAGQTFVGPDIFTTPISSYLLGSGDTNFCAGTGACAGMVAGQTSNVAIGNGVFDQSTNGGNINNVLIGSGVVGATNSSSLTGNVFIGSAAAPSATSADNNVALGFNAATSITTGASNVLAGNQVANDITAGGSNVVIGALALNNSTYDTESGSIVIGFSACRNLATAATLCIDAIDRVANFATESLIYGSFNATVASQTLAFNAGRVSHGPCTDFDGTPAIGTIMGCGSTSDGSTNVLVLRDSTEANVLTVDTDGVVTPGGYKSSDGTAGITQTCATPVTAVTIKNGIITAVTCP